MATPRFRPRRSSSSTHVSSPLSQCMQPGDERSIQEGIAAPTETASQETSARMHSYMPDASLLCESPVEAESPVPSLQTFNTSEEFVKKALDDAKNIARCLEDYEASYKSALDKLDQVLQSLSRIVRLDEDDSSEMALIRSREPERLSPRCLYRIEVQEAIKASDSVAQASFVWKLGCWVATYYTKDSRCSEEGKKEVYTYVRSVKQMFK